ncbi:hypothetical protein LTS10_010141 [Elasticomyces elasticus]|nr:hypothetical protein LTS10_010141 [Elasticomyces elasticus]
MFITPKDRAVSTSYDMPTAYSSVRLCMAWYKGNEDRAPHVLEPGARSRFLRISETPRFENFDDIVHENNEDTFSYFGDGWTLEDVAQTELDKTMVHGQAWM